MKAEKREVHVFPHLLINQQILIVHDLYDVRGVVGYLTYSTKAHNDANQYEASDNIITSYMNLFIGDDFIPGNVLDLPYLEE